MPALLNAADVMVHTSEREGAPLTYREAQGCELPVVATDIPAAREAIEDGRTGVLYPVGDVDGAGRRDACGCCATPPRARRSAARGARRSSCTTCRRGRARTSA